MRTRLNDSGAIRRAPGAIRWIAAGALLAMAAQVSRAPAQNAPDISQPAPAQIAPAMELKLQCANLIYAVNKSSVCFSDKFLSTVARETNLRAEAGFKTVKLADNDLYNYPFALMTGEGAFVLPEQERKNLRTYLERGGFLLASASCSSRDWGVSFKAEINRIFPDHPLKPLPMTHPIFHTVFDVNQIALHHGGQARIEGVEINNRIVLIWSPEGLNDTANVSGCCCCGGNEIENCHEINVNIFTYAVTH